MRWWGVALIGAGAAALGFYAGAKYALNQVQSGVTGEFDKALGFLGVNVNQGYGRTAHNIVDATVGQILQ